MIWNAERTVILSSFGWVEGDAFWRFDVTTASEERIPLASGARYVSLYAGGSDTFSVCHHFDGARVELTVRTFSDPARVLASGSVSADGQTFGGDPQAWANVRRLYLAYLAFAPWKDFVLLLVSAATGEIEVQRLEWYDTAYDKGYQGVVDVLEIPDERAALVSVQRSSRLIVHDLATGAMKAYVDLGGRQGNPVLHWRRGAGEIWASDYDTIVVIDPRTWRRRRSARVQGAASGTQQFIGEYSFGPDDATCVVARPFSGDVVSLNASTLKVAHTAQLGRQPLEAVALSGGDVVARDWKTGDLLRGTMKPRKMFGRA